MSEIDIIKNYKSGDNFTATILKQEVSGKIFIGTRKGSDKIRVFYMQNSKSGSKPEAGPQFGFSSSWLHDYNILNIVITPNTPQINNNYEIW